MMNLVCKNLLEVGHTLLLEGGEHHGKVGKSVNPQVHPGLLGCLKTRHQHLWGGISLVIILLWGDILNVNVCSKLYIVCQHTTATIKPENLDKNALSERFRTFLDTFDKYLIRSCD